MVKVGKWIAKHRILILIIATILLFPSAIGYENTRTNYDVLTYLPDSLETMQGQEELVDDFGMGGFAMVVVENNALKDVAALETKIEAVPHVKGVLWYDDLADITLPVEMVPERLRKDFFNGDATMMIVLLDDGTSTENSMNAVDQITDIVSDNCYVGGSTAVVNDLRHMADKEVPIYVLLAVVLCLIAMELTGNSFVTPFLFLISIGYAVIYNMGTNFMFGEISYITKAIAAVLQLGVTMDYSIFLQHSYEENKKRFPGDRERAMGHAISNTFESIIGSSVTTIAGFVALCFMTFTLGLNLGLVMIKGVIFGVLSCVTILPSLILLSDKAIQKTTHRSLVDGMAKASGFITRHYKVWLVIFCCLFPLAVYGNNHVKVYYDMSSKIPQDMPSKIATKKMQDDFDTATMHVVMVDKNLPEKEKTQMLKDIEAVDGVSYAIGLNSFIGPSFPEDMIPQSVRSMLESDTRELMIVNTDYKVGTDEINAQIDEISSIVKGYDSNALVIGEGPLTKDLETTTGTDFRNVNSISIVIVFLIIAFLFKSISLPVILILVIEFAIMLNMSVAFYMGTSLSFISSIILGTVQLGSTVDYAILMTTRYKKERGLGKDKRTAVSIAHENSMVSIFISGLSFFSATFGVSLYSKIDILNSICLLLARGALISAVSVIFVLPSMLMVFDKLITKTSCDFFGIKAKKRREKISQMIQKKAQEKNA